MVILGIYKKSNLYGIYFYYHLLTETLDAHYQYQRLESMKMARSCYIINMLIRRPDHKFLDYV